MRPQKIFRLCTLLCAVGAVAAGCGNRPIKPSDLHLQRPPSQNTSADIPLALIRNIALSAPKPAPKEETYSVVVENLSAQEILFALARDAKINLDIHPGIQGTVTLNALNQTLPQILNRIAKQIDMRYELDHGSLIVMPDSPYLHSYKIDYVNMIRDTNSGIANTTQVGSSASSTGTTDSSGSNNSQISIKNISKNHFWDTLIQNIKDILHETDKILPDGSSETVTEQSGGTDYIVSDKKNTLKKSGGDTAPTRTTIQEGDSKTVTRRSTFREAASVIANPESSIITVRATGRQHNEIQAFIDRVMNNARRQVLIEMTVVEVNLNDQYQRGINWSKLLQTGVSKGFSLGQAGTLSLPSTPGVTPATFILNYTNPTSDLGNLSASVSLLETFGDLRVLSSPKLSVMNNQTAVLRVVNNLIYFNIKAEPTVTVSPAGVPITTYAYTSTPQTAPVGFTVSVTPQISDSDSVQISIRPTITRFVQYINDPNPDLANAGVKNPVPETQTREMESVLKIENNQIAVMGGLMQDEMNNLSNGIPGLSRAPVIGSIFTSRNDRTTKTELVIFLRPIVIKDASVKGDFSAYQNLLPDQNFFKRVPDQESFEEPENGKP